MAVCVAASCSAAVQRGALGRLLCVVAVGALFEWFSSRLCSPQLLLGPRQEEVFTKFNAAKKAEKELEATRLEAVVQLTTAQPGPAATGSGKSAAASMKLKAPKPARATTDHAGGKPSKKRKGNAGAGVPVGTAKAGAGSDAPAARFNVSIALLPEHERRHARVHRASTASAATASAAAAPVSGPASGSSASASRPRVRDLQRRVTIAVHNRVSNLPTVVGKAGEDVVDAKGELDNDLGLASLVLRLSTGLHTVPAGSASFTAKQASDAWSVLSDTITRIEDRSVLSVSVCLSVCLCACASVVRCRLSVVVLSVWSCVRLCL